MLLFTKAQKPASPAKRGEHKSPLRPSASTRNRDERSEASTKTRKQNQGFSLSELLVSLFILTMLMLVVMPNFRAGQKSQEIDINLKQLVEGITSVRTKSLAGQVLINETWPTGTTTEGYGIRFLVNSQEYELFALLPDYVEIENRKPKLPTSPQEIGNIKIISLWGLESLAADGSLPEFGKEFWKNFEDLATHSASLEIIFSLPDSIAARPADDEAGKEFKYVGGIIEHVKSGRQGYFYVSLLSGAVNYGLY